MVFGILLGGCTSGQVTTLESTSTEVAPSSTDTGSTGEAAPPGGTTGAVDSTSTTALDSTSSGGGTIGNPISFDLPPIPDAGSSPPGTATCDNLDRLGPTSVGCEFWAAAVPITASGFGEGLGWGISVGNPFDDHNATITIEDQRGPGGTLRMFHQFVLGPRESQIINMNGNAGVMPGEIHTVSNVGLGDNTAFRITADSPVTAMQINPIGGASSFLPEASMLLPINALGQAYYGMSYTGGTQEGGFVVVVATEDGTTVDSDEGVQMLDAFDTYTFTSATDPTGFFVGADRPIAVFSGHPCTFIPADLGWCDHLEEAVIPLAAWGSHYVAARHPHREPLLNPTPELVFWRVIAGVDNVTISVQPSGIVPGDQIVLSSAGDWAELASNQNFVVSAPDDQPFMLVQYMVGGDIVLPWAPCLSGTGPAVGDPYMMQMVPTEQWLTSLPFLTDDSYAQDFVVLVRETGTQVELDCLGTVSDDHFEGIPGSSYEVGVVELDIDGMGGEGACVDGQQFVVSSQPIGVSVGGYDCHASYGYPGGLSLSALWQPPTSPPG